MQMVKTRKSKKRTTRKSKQPDGCEEQVDGEFDGSDEEVGGEEEEEEELTPETSLEEKEKSSLVIYLKQSRRQQQDLGIEVNDG
ncbi:hypothetical protein R1sor_010912 [Riccia sorocarpa]|uniref:Uncharacterized protein n=1 Tax=Riccia sorocarpa TaxID=122646 RepID=A0ABD3I3H5_9MARC